MIFAELVVIGVNEHELNMSIATFVSSLLKLGTYVDLIWELVQLSL